MTDDIVLDIVNGMKKALVVRLDEDLSDQIERFVPARSRGQSAFIRKAILRAIMDLQEMETRRAYERLPDNEPAPLPPDSWEREDWSNEAPKRKAGRRGRR